ncbi:IS4 family transposase [Corallococcus exiguus]|uniref:IS4 family transposase n=1 Tax=Corallococcus TaxID=83461 RepID=UPI000EC911D9|nr:MULTISPECIES: IS4 family transposase [Corallococcus]NNB94140.1 IS4 family transposase [Corallococcus exiguus]NPC47568.1 IS4 family transposase [Corallococcus exiguus]RKH80831.1 IS4 family transposase [Corallococcus sp. AB032C]
MRRKVAIDAEQVRAFLTEVFEDDLHVKRILSLSHATLGAVQAASLSVAAIGKAMAWARGEDVTSKHAVKQVDRLLSNGGFDVWRLFAAWVPFVLAERTEAVIALDWTDFEQDDQETLVASLITQHGRATPLLWTTLVKSASAGNRQLVEDQTLQRLREVIASEVKVTVVADRGFADAKFYALLRQLGFEYVVRFRADVLVTSEDAETKPGAEWVPEGGRAKVLRGARVVTAAMAQVGAVVCVKRKGMKDSWCLATSLTEATAQQVLDVYARRFTIEETFRDVKDLKFGMGLKQVRVKTPERRDRLLLISALAQVLLTLLGAAGEALGYDKHLRVNTVKRRTHSLFTQGAYYFMAMPRMSDERLRPLVERFGQLVRELAVFREAFGLI